MRPPFGRRSVLQPTDIRNPDYFHKVVDCQWACPAHTPVPEYIRLIAEQRYTEAWAINWESNVFPGILGRTCDRPCEPACRRVRVEAEPVAICRLKRVAADNKGDISPYLPAVPKQKDGKRIALVGAGPASLTVARDLAPLGYDCVMFDGDAKGGGMMRTQIPRFRLPESVTDEEVDRIVDLGIETRYGQFIGSLKALLTEGWDAVFVGSGAPRGRELDIPGRKEAAANIHIGIDWLSSVSIGQENAFPWIERDVGIEFDRWGMPKVDPKTMQSSLPNVFFGGDAAFGPKNIIWAVAHGHEAAISIDKLCHGEDVNDRPPPGVTLVSQKMGIHEWSYDNDISNDLRYKVPLRDIAVALKDIRTEVELGYDDKLAYLEAERCLNCDIQTVFNGKLCIECDACVDICPMDCITFTENGDEEDLRTRLSAPAINLTQDRSEEHT